MTEAVFFDLDGTLADTAPDLGAALNALREELGLAPVDPAKLRPHASRGTRGMLDAGLQRDPSHPDYRMLASRFLALYQRNLSARTQLFEGVEPLLEALEQRGLPWGIVTNKPSRLTLPLLSALGLRDRCVAIVSGDSTPFPKPSPAPLQLACRLSGQRSAHSLYVGDDLRDVQCGRSAGSRTLAACWGYLGSTAPPTEWLADALIEHPLQLLDHL